MSSKHESANLDLLRSVAVLLVVGSHAAFFLGHAGIAGQVYQVGRLGVLLFFIHTSLVLMMSLERLEKTGAAHLVRRFYIRRAFRIYPLAIVAVLAVVVLRIPAEFNAAAFSSPSATQLWSNLLLIQNVNGAGSLIVPLWSLPYEVQMYLVLPFLYMLGKWIRAPWAILAIGIGAWLAGHLLERRGMPPLLDYTPWFCMGVAAFFRRPTRRLSGRLWVTALALMLAGDFLLVAVLSRDYWAAYVQWLLGISFCLVLPMFRDLAAPVANRVFHLIAKYSYGIYLSHHPILWGAFIGLAAEPVWVRAGLAVLLLVAIPVILYHTLENPFIRLGMWLAEDRQPRLRRGRHGGNCSLENHA
jgi:peptidoglycan/LPS O-acetylase OafA/YrhL